MSHRTYTELDWVRAVANYAPVYELPPALAPREEGVGRPPLYNDVAIMQLIVLRGFTGSMRRAASIMQEPTYWAILREAIRTHCGDVIADQTKQDCGPNRHHWFQQKDRFDASTDAALVQYRDHAREQALEQGLLDPDAPCSVKHPLRSATVVGDGTVVTSPVNPRTKKETDAEKPPRTDASAQWHREAGEEGGSKVFGVKFVHLSVRGSARRHDRVILDLVHDPGGSGYGGEMQLAIDMITRLHDATPGLHGVRYDGALRGVHRDTLMKRGLLVLAPPHGGTKPRLIEHTDACGCPGGHDLWTRNGALHVRHITVDGEVQWVALPVTKLERRGRRTYRWAHLIALPCGVEHRVRIDTTDADQVAKLHRPEHLHQHAPGSNVYDTTYGWREDAENINSELDNTLFRGRMVAYGPAAQTWVMLGFIMSRNALSAREYQHRSQETAPVAA